MSMSINYQGVTQSRRIGTLVRKCVAVLIFLVSLNGVAIQVPAQTPGEYQVKAAFILNFARFIEWPGDAYSEGGVLVVGIVGDDPFGSALNRLNGSTVNGRRIAIRRLKVGDNLKSCQILFISSSERYRLGKILDSVKGSSVLTIGDLSQFNQAGGIIKFVIQDDKVRFEINAGAAVQARLRISSKLLALSKGGRS